MLFILNNMSNKYYYLLLYDILIATVSIL